MLASDGGSGEMFHALIIIEMIGFKGSAKEPWGTTRVILLWVVAASAVRPKPPLLRTARATAATVRRHGIVANLRKRHIALVGCRDQAAIANNDAIMMRCDPMSLAGIDATCPLRIIAKIS